MARSSTLNPNQAQSPAGQTARRKVLVTGAAGRIGSYFAENSHQKYDLRLMVHPGEENAEKILRPSGK